MALRSIRFRTPLLFVAIGLVGWAAACGSTNGSNFGDGTDKNKVDASFGTSSGFLGDGGSSGNNGDGGPNANDTLRVDPATITITATGTLKSLIGQQSFKAYVGTSTTPVDALWSVDDAGIGAIDNSGLFKTATYAGHTQVRARVGNLTGLADVTVIFKIEEDLTGGSGLTDDVKTKLKAGGTADASKFKWLYPYDNTVFPRGLLAPKLMFGGASPKAYWVHLSTKNVDYSGFYDGAANPQPRVIVSEDWWSMVTRSAGPNDPVTIQVSKIDTNGTDVTGPISETWSIAQGSLRGTVFYNTYNSTLVNAANAVGAVMRLKPGAPVEVFIGKTTVMSKQDDGSTQNDGGVSSTTSTCTVCHSVSANGTALAAGLNWGDGNNPFDSALFSIDTTGAATPRFSTSEGRRFPFGAFTFDGNWLVGSGTAFNRGLSGTYYSRLYNAKTGAVVDDDFFGKGAVDTDANKKLAFSPAFSPDTTHIAFGDRNSDANGHQLSIMDVSMAGGQPAFSNLKKLANDVNKVLGWPSFLPDSKAILYGAGSTYDTGTFTNTAQLGHQCGELQWIDLGTGLTTALSALNGYKKDGSTSYLPFFDVPDPDTANGDSTPCNTQDLHMNYEPTVLPVAVGGYYWVVFTSRRAYGNFIWQGANSVTAAGDLPFDNTQDGSGAIKGYRKKLWVAAIDINGTAGNDISHPAFLLEGQEMAAGNMRGFWALDPCKGDGQNCNGGDECCNGFCRAVDNGAGGTTNACVPPPTGGANESEKCTVSADCCTAADGTTCINGFCTTGAPPPVK
jgi:hypothetical protein